MAKPGAVERALAAAARDLRASEKRFALVGGIAVSVRAEVRFTRDVDIAVAVTDDAEAEALVFDLRSRGYVPSASVEHDARGRLATIRLLSSVKIKVDLLFASSGIEGETVARATPLELPHVGTIPVARAEELLAMKVLSMTERRLQDRIDAQNLLLYNPALDLAAVRAALALVTERGYDRNQDLGNKLDDLLNSLR